jgi:hypothetical protein
MKGLRRSEQAAYLERFRETYREAGEGGEAGAGLLPGSPGHGAASEQSRCWGEDIDR